MRGEGLVGFLHADVSGLRGRSVPDSELEERIGAGVGWVPADQAPPSALSRSPTRGARPATSVSCPTGTARCAWICGRTPRPSTSSSATRRTRTGAPGTLAAHAAQALPLLARRRDGAAPHLLFRAGVRAGGPAFEPGPGFSFEAQRLVEPFAPLVFAALRQAGLEPETFLPEYGRGSTRSPAPRRRASPPPTGPLRCGRWSARWRAPWATGRASPRWLPPAASAAVSTST